jgi:hypothetical protein
MAKAKRNKLRSSVIHSFKSGAKIQNISTFDKGSLRFAGLRNN